MNPEKAKAALGLMNFMLDLRITVSTGRENILLRTNRELGKLIELILEDAFYLSDPDDTSHLTDEQLNNNLTYFSLVREGLVEFLKQIPKKEPLTNEV